MKITQEILDFLSEEDKDLIIMHMFDTLNYYKQAHNTQLNLIESLITGKTKNENTVAKSRLSS
jgi:hypothetical protein